ncbi:MAG: 3-oxoacyl-[acyl-carrier-protein] synthase 2 [Syntrophus sp. SKADARSKE-3]|nr:3-oxoacyl-[acyl-carrier-protein] synthase 2 [Syntrophus sp. SKADARSKE-3]
MEKKQRIVITGMGTLNAVAGNVPEFTKALQDGACGIETVDLFDTAGCRCRNGGQVKRFNPHECIPSTFSMKRTSRADRLCLAATLEALRDAGLYPLTQGVREDMGIAIGGGSGGLLEAESFYADVMKKGSGKARFSTLASVYCASSADFIASQLGLFGPKITLMTACSAGGTVLGYGRDMIRNGQAAFMIAGGVEPMCKITYTSFNALKSLDPDICRPFDKNRQGLSLGEAAAIMILEPLEMALYRGARIYGEILGYGVTCDSHHMTAPDEQGSGAARSMAAALQDSGISIDDIDYINAHGTATLVNDVMETKAIKAVFGKRAYEIPVSSTKAMTGHTLAAAGALEGIVSILAMVHSFIPPTIHHRDPDPLCDLDYVSEGERRADVRAVLSNSFAFGGNNTTVIFGRYDEGCPA